MEENFRILKPYLRGFPIILLAMVIAIVAAKKYLGYVTPMYESTVKLKLADVSEGVPSSNLFKDFDVFANSNKIAAEIEVIKSNMMINKVLDSLEFDLEVYRVGKVRKVELYRESPFIIRGSFTTDKAFDKTYGLQVHSKESFTITFSDGTSKKGVFGGVIRFSEGQFFIDLNQNVIESKSGFLLVDAYEFEFLSREKLVGKIATNLDVISIDKDVAVIRISLKSPIAEKAAQFVNMMAKTYINDYIDTKYKAANTTVKFLEGRIRDIASKLSTSEQSIQNFRDDRSITNIHQETETDLRKISQLKIQQANLKMNLDAIEDLHQYIKQGKDNFLELAPNFEAFTDLLSTEIVKKIKQLQSDKKDLLLVFTPEDERVKIIDLKINDLTSYLIESIANTHNNLQIKYDRLVEEITEAEKVFIDVPEKERLLTILNREFEIFQRSYNFLNEKKIEAEIAQAAKIAFHRIISPAAPSLKPISPNRPIIIIVSAIMAMFGTIVLIFLVHAAKAKVNDVYTIERNSSIPIALLTPNLVKEDDQTRHFLKEAIQMELKGILHPKDILVLTSGKTKEGTAFHAWHLAKAFAAQGRKVLLADVEKRFPFVGNGATEPQSTSIDGISYLDISGPQFGRFTKVMLEQYWETFRTTYDIIIIANESLSNETVGLLMMSIANTNLFLLDSRRTSEKQIGQVSLLQKEYSLPNIWFVLNRAGYNPNVLRELMLGLQWCVAYLKRGKSK